MTKLTNLNAGWPLCAMVTGAIAIPSLARAAGEGGMEGGGHVELPATLEVTGIVRDFRERTDPEGHTDFERRPDEGFGRYSGNVSRTLGANRKPVFTGNGFKVGSEWRDSSGRNICHLLFDPNRNDQPGSAGGPSNGGIDSADSFSQWFNDEPGMNMSMPLTLTLALQQDGQYV